MSDVDVGVLVVIDGEADRGVGRVESIGESVDGDLARVWLYASGAFVVRPRARLQLCPDNAPVRPA